MNKRKLIGEAIPEALVADGFDDCIIGICERFGQEPIVAYDKDKMLQKMVDDGMEYEDAVEHFNFNIIGAWIGETTPCFIEVVPDEVKHGFKEESEE